MSFQVARDSSNLAYLESTNAEPILTWAVSPPSSIASLVQQIVVHVAVLPEIQYKKVLKVPDHVFIVNLFHLMTSRSTEKPMFCLTEESQREAYSCEEVLPFQIVLYPCKLAAFIWTFFPELE
jgi:hypothetical protein